MTVISLYAVEGGSQAIAKNVGIVLLSSTHIEGDKGIEENL